MKIDLYLEPGTLAAADRRARWAEELEFAGVFVPETNHDPFLTLVRVAAASRRIQLGTAIAVAFARSPVVLAHTSWDLSAFSSGRFLLGLGTQVRGHIIRRFSMEWGRPVPRLKEYVEVLRAVWRTWQTGEELRYQGEFYRHSLMTPFFSPPPIDHPDIPIYIAGVGPFMCRLAGELCQGFHVHPFHTRRYLDEVILPNIQAGAAASGRSLDDVERAATVFVVTGRDDRDMERGALAVKRQLAFYASTPDYAGILELHGWDFGPTLTAMSKRGEWDAMAEVVPDELLAEVAVRAPIDELGGRLRERYEGRIDRVGLYWSTFEPTDEEWSGVIDAAR